MSGGTLQAVYEAIESNRLNELRTLLPITRDATTAIKCGSSRFIVPLLGYAARHGNLEAVKILLEVKDINLDIVGQYSDATPLNAAIVEALRSGKENEAKKYMAIAEMLLIAGANPNARCTDITPLYRVIGAKTDGRRNEILALLIRHRADVNMTGMHARTPLMVAAHAGRIDDVRLLVKCGAHADLSDDAGHTALHYAREGKHSKCIAYLEGLESAARKKLEKVRPAVTRRPSLNLL